MFVCTCVIPVCKLKHSSTCFANDKVQKEEQKILVMKKDIVTLLVSKSTPSDAECFVDGCVHLKCLQLVQKVWASASVKLWDVLYSCIYESLSCSLSASRLLFGFCMTESKGRITLEYHFFSQYIYLKKFMIQFCILLKVSTVTLI